MLPAATVLAISTQISQNCRIYKCSHGKCKMEILMDCTSLRPGQNVGNLLRPALVIPCRQVAVPEIVLQRKKDSDVPTLSEPPDVIWRSRTHPEAQLW